MYMYMYILINHLAVQITVIISEVVVWPIVLNTKRRFMFLLTRDRFLNHYPTKPFVICQFDMFTFAISQTMCSILFFL